MSAHMAESRVFQVQHDQYDWPTRDMLTTCITVQEWSGRGLKSVQIDMRSSSAGYSGCLVGAHVISAPGLDLR
ncbi:hypothetical protein J6590_010541 [Homalodisca vitripennis]|nr:hypothetical protein J6590_010541 [Homalodisca vitripennis]